MVHTAISTTINVGDWVGIGTLKDDRPKRLNSKATWLIEKINEETQTVEVSNNGTGLNRETRTYYFSELGGITSAPIVDVEVVKVEPVAKKPSKEKPVVGIKPGDWVEVTNPNKNRLSILKNSRWLVEVVNTEKAVYKVGNGKTGEDSRTEYLEFKEVTLTTQFVKGDNVQLISDPRYIGLVIKEGKEIKVKWADASESFVSPDSIILFTRIANGTQQILGKYAFNAGDRVAVDLLGFEGMVFTVQECKPSGQVVTESEDGFSKNFAGCKLSVIGHQSPVTSEEEPEEVEPVEPNCVNVTDSLAWIDPRKVDTEAGTQTRYREDAQQISLYAEKMTAGEWEWEREPLPELVQDGENFYPVSGHHRIKAALMASSEDDATQIYCRIIPGTLEGAKLLAVRSNSNDYHGVPESRADFRNRVEKFFNILDEWDFDAEVRELENLKLQPYASEQVGAIDQLLSRFRKQGMTEMWSSRIVAAYLRSPRSYHTITRMLAVRQTESVFRSLVSSLSNGDCVRYQDDEEIKIGRIIYLSKTTITVLAIDKTYITLNSSSPVELLQSIEVTELVEAEQPATEPTEEDKEEETPSPPVKKSMGGGGVGGDGIQSVSQELREKAKELGLPTSSTQVMPDTSESDRLRNASPHDVDDRPFAAPAPVPDVSEYLIGFVSNVQDMNQPQICRALESIFEWMESRGQDQNLGYLKTVIDSL